jgi:hypothetical protein
MSDIPGNGASLKLAQNTAIVLASRAFSIIGVPIAAWLFLQVWGSVDDMRKTLVDVRISFVKMEGLLGTEIELRKRSDDESDRRLKVLERVGKTREP